MDSPRIMVPLWAELRELLVLKSWYWGLPGLLLSGHCGIVSMGEKRPEHMNLLLSLSMTRPIPVAAPSKARVCGRSLCGIAGLKPAGGMDVSVLWVYVCCQAEVSATGWSLVQRDPTECGVSECDHETSIMKRPWSTRGCCAMEKGKHE